MSEEPDWEQAHADLHKAIGAYYAATTGEYCEAWVLITHKRSAELEQQGESAVGVMTARDQPWPLSRGMIEVARENDAFTGYQRDAPGPDDD